jgi:hypothetical protein
MKRLLALTLVCVVAITAVAASQISRPSPISPKNRAALPAGKTPTFKFRSSGAGTHWVHVSKSSRRAADGVIKHDASIGQARRKPGTTTWTQKPKYYNYPGFFMHPSKRGKTYYWQAFRIKCGEESNSNDCKVEGPVRRFKVR